MNMKEFFLFLQNNKKIYINSNTGKGKTLILTIFALLYANLNPNNKIISNYHLNIYNKYTNKSMCEYTKYSLLPFNKLLNGNYLILIDDFISVKRYLKNFNSVLATLSRKTNIDVMISLHYYTHLEKEVRELFHYEVIPKLFNLSIDNKLTEKSFCKMDFYEPSSLEFKFNSRMNSLLQIVNGNLSFNNIYIKGKLYDTNEVVHFLSESKMIQEIANMSNDLNEIEMNCELITSTQSKIKRLIKESCKIKGIECN